MTNTSTSTHTNTGLMSPHANALATRLEEGAQRLAAFAAGLTDAEWRTRTPKDGRPVGVIIHHVATVYPLEVQLAQLLAQGLAITNVTADAINEMNAGHAAQHGAVTKDETLALLRRNSAEAAAAIRELSDDQLNQAATVSLYENAPLTCQFLLEDHAVRHSYHHLALLQQAVQR